MRDLRGAQARGPLIAAILLTLLATISVALRLVSRRMRKIKLGPDDYTIMLGLVGVYSLLGLEIASIQHGGVGYHAKELQPNQVVTALKLMLPIETMYGITMAAVKIGILLFYLRIFVTKAFRITAIVCMVISVAWGAHVILEGFLLCRPLALNWNPTLKGTCGNRNAAFAAAGATNMATDVLVLLLPIPTILKLQMPRANKIALCGIFALGLFTCATSIIRLKSLLDIEFTDVTYTLAQPLMWTTIEPSLAIIINACLPIMRPLFVYVLPARLFKITSGNVASSGPGGLRSAEPRKFSRLGGDEYPLTYVEGVSHTSEVTSHRSDVKFAQERTESINDEESQGGSHSGHDDTVAPKGFPGISVKREWNIRRL